MRTPRDWRGDRGGAHPGGAANGEFENLKGKGQPLRLDQNTYAGDRALAYSLLKEQRGRAARDRARQRDRCVSIERAEELLASCAASRDALRVGTAHAFPASAAPITSCVTTLRPAMRRLRGINSKILSLNIVAPPSLHRRRLDVEAKMRAFEEEFPRLEE